MSDYYDEPWSEPYRDDWRPELLVPERCTCDHNWRDERCPLHGELESLDTPSLGEFMLAPAPDTLPEHWAAFVATGATATDRAQEALEDILGFQGTGHEDVDMLEGKGGHKPPRSDIQKYKTAYEESEAGRILDSTQRWEELAVPDEKQKLRKQKLEDKATAWQTKTALTDREQMLIDAYKNMIQIGFGDLVPAGRPQAAFQWLVDTFGEHGIGGDGGYLSPEALGGPEGMKKILGGALKKYEYSQYPKLYQGIKDTLDDLYRRHSDEHETYKLWPWAVSELKRQFATNIWGKDSNFPNFRNTNRQHLVDIVDQTGGLLHQLRQEHRLPQGLDANQFKSLQEMEDWLMQYRREHGQGDDGGKTVHEFDDGWKVLKLHQPNQLTWEGDEMDHCVGGYWQQVRDGRSHIYSIRNQENKPQATLEFNPPYNEGSLYELVKEYNQTEGAQEFKKAEHDPELKTVVTSLFDTPEEYGQALQLAKDSNQTLQGYPQLVNAAALLPFAKKIGLFKKVESAHEPFAENDKQLYRPIRNGSGYYPTAMQPYSTSDQKLAMLNQHMGAHDNSPDSDSLRHIKDWFDHHRQNGWDIQRNDGFFYPNNWEHGGNDDYDDHTIKDASALDDWFNDRYRANPDRYKGVEEYEDPLGFKTQLEGQDPPVQDWSDLLEECAASLLDDYDRHRWKTNNWEGLAQQVWHAWWVAERYDNPDKLKGAAEMMEKYLQNTEDKLHQWVMDYSDYGYGGQEYNNEVREHFEKMHPDWDDEEHGDPEDHPDWEEAQNQRHYAIEDSYAGDAYKFFNYLHNLLYHVGGTGAANLPDPSEKNAGLPAYHDLMAKNEQAQQESIPGALSHVAADGWSFDDTGPEGNWHKWGWNPQYGGLVWDTEHSDGMPAHIDAMNKAWVRPGRYPFHPDDRTGVAFYRPEHDTLYVSQYPRGAGDAIQPEAWPELEQRFRNRYPTANISWPVEPNWNIRVSSADQVYSKEVTASASFPLPPVIVERFISAGECPYCHGHLRSGNGTYCEECGWTPQQEQMKTGYRIGGEVVDLQQYREQHRCPVCASPTSKDAAQPVAHCKNCNWIEGDPVEACPACKAVNTVELAPNASKWPYECQACKTRFTYEELYNE